MYGNDITIINAGITHTITPTIPLYDHFRIVGTATLVGNVSISYDPTYTPVKWDVICFSWEATVTLGTSSVTIFGTTLTKEQCSGKGFIHCMYDGSAWVVRYYSSISGKAAGIGGATTQVLTNGGGTINMDIRKNDNTLSLTGSPTLSSSWTIQTAGTPVAGDMQICYYCATATVGANTITIFGKTLTTAQALAGDTIVIQSYDGSSWRTILLDPILPPIWESGSGISSIQSIGTSCNASGDYSIATGTGTTASGNYSNSEGQDSIASGVSSHAEGNTTIASGDYSHAEGAGTIASGNYSHAEGIATSAIGDYSHTEGKESVAHLYASSAFSNGKFTILGDCEELHTYLKKVTIDATPANMLLGDNATTGIEIPTDCIIDFECRYTALQTAGAGGTIGDCVTQKITFSVQNLAGTLTLLTQGIATTATIVTKTSNVIYYEPATIGALAATCVPGISGTKVLFVVTGEATKDVQHSCLVSMNINGFGNFSI